MAPRAKAADRIEIGTVLIASLLAIIMTGRISRLMVKAPDIKLRSKLRPRTKMVRPMIP